MTWKAKIDLESAYGVCGGTQELVTGWNHLSKKKKTNQRKGADLKPLTSGDNLFGDRNSIKQRRVCDVSLPISTPKFSV